MSKIDGLLNRLQGWAKKYLSLPVKQDKNVQVAGNTLNSVAEQKLDKNQIAIGSTNTQIKLASPFILGLDDIKDVQTLTNENFQSLIQWDWSGQIRLSKIEVPGRETLSTQDLLNSISWDFESNSTLEQIPISVGKVSLASTFLIGLEDIPNLETLVNKELANSIKWEGNKQPIMPLEIEDYSLLDDLLGTFPE